MPGVGRRVFLSLKISTLNVGPGHFIQRSQLAMNARTNLLPSLRYVVKDGEMVEVVYGSKEWDDDLHQYSDSQAMQGMAWQHHFLMIDVLMMS